MSEKRLHWALPGVVFVSAFTMSAACGSENSADVGPDCPTIESPTGGNEDPSTTAVTSASSSTSAAGSTSTSASTGAGAMGPGEDPGEEEMIEPPPGAQEINSRLHGCRKLRFDTLGNMLGARGVAVTSVNTAYNAAFGATGMACEVIATPLLIPASADPLCPAGQLCYCPPGRGGCVDVGTPSTAGDAQDGFCVAKPQTASFLYATGDEAFSVPALDSRLAEKDGHTTASALRLMDIFVQAAPQIIANIGDPAKAPACVIDGKSYPMFDAADNSCVEESVSCIIGSPATEDHMLLCNLIVGKAKPGDAADLQKKKIIAVAALMSAAHSCE